MKDVLDFGPQYQKDDDFKARARLHQSRFRAESLGLAAYETYGNRLAKTDALAGRNFYLPWEGLFGAVQARYALGYTDLYWDMLRSEHIPFNFFLPLRDEPALASAVVSRWLDEPVSVKQIEVEWAPTPREDFLNDNTSFDVMVSYETRGGASGAVGVEVKYTEGEYGWGKTEQARMGDEDSLYNRVHRRSGIYVESAASALRSKRMKQVWRNQLLGEAMLQHPANVLSRFTSVLLYPSGNHHFESVVPEYQRLLRSEVRTTRFVAATYEGFIETLRAHAPSSKASDWIDYLERRYVFPLAATATR